LHSSELRGVDPEAVSFRARNTPADYETLQHLWPKTPT
jgi:hypothetical protein